VRFLLLPSLYPERSRAASSKGRVFFTVSFQKAFRDPESPEGFFVAWRPLGGRRQSSLAPVGAGHANPATGHLGAFATIRIRHASTPILTVIGANNLFSFAKF